MPRFFSSYLLRYMLYRIFYCLYLQLNQMIYLSLVMIFSCINDCSDDQGTLDEESDDCQELYSEKNHSSDSNSESGDEQVKNDIAARGILFVFIFK